MANNDDKNPENRGNKMLPRNNDANRVIVKEAFNAIDRIIDIMSTQGKLMEERTRKDLENYLKTISKNAKDFNDDRKMLDFLLSEKSKFNNQIIEANIKKDVCDKKYLESFIKIIIDPLIIHIKETLLLKQTIPAQIPHEISKETIINTEEMSKMPGTSDHEASLHMHNSPAPSSDILAKLPVDFQQIRCKASMDEIINYFMRLATKKNEINGMPYMNNDDIMELLHKNFIIFNKMPIAKYFPINLISRQKGRLRYFIYIFYSNYSFDSQDKDRFAYFLIHNFDLFKNSSLNNVKSNMGTTKRPIEKHTI